MILIKSLKDFTEWISQEQEKWVELDFGLSIAKEILEQNDGRIDIKSELGKGTEVVIRIPTVQALEKNSKNTQEKNKKEDE